MKKKITFVALNFYPEDTAIGLYSTQLAEYLSQNNFKVKVITGFPYYPNWKIPETYKDKKTNFTENYKGIEIIRRKQYVPKNPTFFKRILLLLDFTFGAYKNASKIKNTDLVFTVVPFTSSILAGNRIANKNKAKHWVHIQDFEFDAAAETNLVGKKKNIFKFLFWIEKKLLAKPDAVSTISNAMLLKLKAKTQNKQTSHLLPNWVDLDSINPNTAKQHAYMNSDKFKVLYSGNIGEKQDWDMFLQVVKEFKGKDVTFIVVGNGGKKEWLTAEIKEIENVVYYPPVPYEELGDLLCSADAHILFQKNNVIDTVMPSKILGMMASEKPSIIAGNRKSEVKKVIEDSGGGFYFENHEVQKIIDTIQELKNNNTETKSIGKNARAYVKENFSSEKILPKFKENLEKLLNTPV